MIKKLGSLKNSTKNRYLIKVYVRDNGKIQSKKKVMYGPKWQAEELELRLKKELRRSVGLKGELDTFSDVLEYYHDQHLKFQKAFRKCVPYVNRLVNDLGQIKASKITPEIFRKYLREDIKGIRKEKLTNATRNRILTFARAAFQFAAENGKVPDNPLRYTRKLKFKEYGRERILTDDEWERLQIHLPQWMLPIVTFAYLVPTRADELKSLKREWIRGNKVWLPGQKTKTGSPRYLPIPPAMKEYFGSIPSESEYVFYHVRKKEYRPIKTIRADWGGFGEALKAADIRGFRFHDLRHTAATNLRRKGVRIELIMAIGGWKSIPTFFRYSNYSDDEIVSVYAE